MSFEIELKAHVETPGAVKERLSLLADYEGACEKDDTYWISAAGNSGLPPSGLRVRHETGIGDGGRVSEKTLVTYKIRETRDSIEVNDEREFTVSDREVFEDLLGRLGLKRNIRKNKRGWAWIYRPPESRVSPDRDAAAGGLPVRAELSEVGGLGWFLELEILAPGNDGATIARSRGELLSLLEKIGIPRGKIEERPYTEMIARALAGKPPA